MQATVEWKGRLPVSSWYQARQKKILGRKKMRGSDVIAQPRSKFV